MLFIPIYLDPDRYEFYTFNDDGDLVKRLMTMEEIQSIVANGDSEQPVAALAKNPTETVDNEANIRDIVNNVQKVLHSEIVNNNFTQSLMHNKLETPDTSSSWSSILPAIFGNTGDSILANKVATTGNTADSILMSQTVNKKPNKNPSTLSNVKTTPTPSKTTVNKIIKQKPKPSSATTTTSLRPNTLTQNIKHTSTTKTEQTIKNTLSPNSKIPYSKQNTTLISKPTKSATVAKPFSSLKPSTVYIQKLSTERITQSPTPSANKSTLPATNAVTATKKPVSKRPVTSSKLPANAFKTSSASITSSISTSTSLPLTVETSTKKNKTVGAYTVLHSNNIYKTTTIAPKKKSGTTTLKPKTTKITANNVAELKENFVTSTVKYVTTSAQPTRKTATSPIRTTTHVTPQKPYPNLDALAVIEPEPENIFDSELSLNQIIESLKDLEGTTIPYASNYMGMVDMTTFETETMPSFEKFDIESVTIPNDGGTTNSQLYQEKEDADFKQKIANIVSYIPQTTVDFTLVPSTTQKYIHLDNNNNQSNTKSHLNSINLNGIEHKESDDEMILDENTTTQISDISTTTEEDIDLNKHSTNIMDTLLRESFDSVLSQIQNDDLSTTVNYTDFETTTYIPVMKTNDKKKTVVKPTPFIPMEELDGAAATEPMKYFEAVIKQYEEEKNRTELMNKTTAADPTTTKLIEPMLIKTTENSFEIETTTDQPSTENNLLKTEKITTELMTQDDYNENETQTTDFNYELTTKDITTTESTETSTIRFMKYSTVRPEDAASSKTESVTEFLNEDSTTTEKFSNIDESTTIVENLEQTTNFVNDSTQASDEKQTKYEMVQLIENIVKNISDEKTNGTNLVQRKEDLGTNRDEIEFSDLGETVESHNNKSNAPVAVKSSIKHPTLAPILNDLKMKIVNALKNTNMIKLDPAPKQSLGLEESTANAGVDILEFAKICNEVAFNFWIALNNEGGISSARSLILSPFALTSMMGKFFPFNFDFFP